MYMAVAVGFVFLVGGWENDDSWFESTFRR